MLYAFMVLKPVLHFVVLWLLLQVHFSMFMLLHGNANNNLSDVCANALYNVVVHAMPGILPAGLQDLLLLLLVDLFCAC